MSQPYDDVIQEKN